MSWSISTHCPEVQGSLKETGTSCNKNCTGWDSSREAWRCVTRDIPQPAVLTEGDSERCPIPTSARNSEVFWPNSYTSSCIFKIRMCGQKQKKAPLLTGNSNVALQKFHNLGPFQIRYRWWNHTLASHAWRAGRTIVGKVVRACPRHSLRPHSLPPLEQRLLCLPIV